MLPDHSNSEWVSEEFQKQIAARSNGYIPEGICAKAHVKKNKKEGHYNSCYWNIERTAVGR